MKVIVVDDDPFSLSFTSTLVRNCGHDVLEASDGEMAWELLQCQDISLMVSDWLMPGLSGTDLCRRVRTTAFGRYVYIILCTSKGEKADLIEGMDAGADDFMVKPISAEEMRVRLRAGERVLSLASSLADRNRALEEANRKLQETYEHIESDIRAAAWVQQNLLPPPSLKELGVSCSWCFRPSSYMSGDIFNFFPVDDRHLGFYLLDVSGHGVPAAMFSVGLSLMMTPDGSHGSPLKRYDPCLGRFEAARPGEVVSVLNRRFQTKDERHFTMSYGVLDPRESILRLAQAGNPNPVLIRSGGQVRPVSSGGMPVGLWPDIDFDCVELPFTPGDRLVLYSDGVSECTNSSHEEFGDDRLLAYLKTAGTEPLEAMLNGLERELESWHGSANFDDDVSLLALEFTKEEMQ